MHLGSTLFFSLFSTYIISVVAEDQQIIVVLYEPTDAVQHEILLHFNNSLPYQSNKLNYNNVTLQKVEMPMGANNSILCDNMTNVQLYISIVRSPQLIELVRRVSELSRIPTIQILQGSWRMDSPSIGGTVNTNLENYVTLISPVSVFQNVFNDVFPLLNITSELTVLYDDYYNASLMLWQEAIRNVAPQSRFVQMERNGTALENQARRLATAPTNILFIARTNAIEDFVRVSSTYIANGIFNLVALTKDVTPFKCETCGEVRLLWIRPYYTGQNSEIRDIQEFISTSEVAVYDDYRIIGAEEMETSFYYDLMGFAVQMLIKRNNTSVFPLFSCNRPPHNESIFLRDIILDGLVHEYGEFIEHSPSILYQNVPSRIFKIDRIADVDDANYNKQLANWTVIQKLYLFYDSLGVDVRDLTHYRVVTLVQPPFVERFPDVNIGPGYQGYCIDLIDLIRNEINFTYTIYEIEDGNFGSMDDNGNWNGVIGAVVSGAADIALAPLSVMAERENDVDFTVPYYDLVGTTILMRKTDVEYSLFKFMKVLEWPVWLCIVGAYLLTSFLLWLFDRFSPYSYSNNKDRYKDDLEKREFSLKECLWFCMTSLTPQGGGEAPKNISGRLVAATWWLFGFIIIASYTANLAAFLTVSRLETSISSLDDLAKQYKIEYAPIKGSASETYFKRMAEVEEQFYNIWKEMSLNESMSPRERAKLAVWDYPVSDKFTNMWRYMQESKLPGNMSAAIQRVLSSPDGFAFIGDATEIKYAVLTNCNLQQVGTEFSRKPYAIAVQTGHPLKDPISSAILLLLNQRKLETLKEKWWNENPNKQVCAVANDESDGISIQNIGGVFIVILAGIVLSIITLGFEYFYYKKNVPVPKPDTSTMIRSKTISNGHTQTSNGNTLVHRRTSEYQEHNRSSTLPGNSSSIMYTNTAFQF